MGQEPFSYLTKIIDNQTGRVITPYNLFEFNLTTVDTGTYSVNENDSFLHVTYTELGPCTITIPTTELSRGNILVVKDAGLNSYINNITVQTEGSETIDGEDSAIISSNGSCINIYTDGFNWFIW